MEILPVVKLMDQDLEPLEAEMESDTEETTTEPVVKEVVEEIVPEVKPKDTIPEDEIFVEKKKDKPPPKEKKKRVMTEAQKETLRKGREKALAVRRAKAEEKKKNQLKLNFLNYQKCCP